MAQIIQIAGGGYCPELQMFLGQGMFLAEKHDNGTYSLYDPAPQIMVEEPHESEETPSVEEDDDHA